MKEIINNDPILKSLILDFEIDWGNDHQVRLRFSALRLAFNKYIDKKWSQIK